MHPFRSAIAATVAASFATWSGPCSFAFFA
jgi:hypothetical protein